LIGWGWTSKIHPEDVEAFVASWLASVQSGEPFLAESRVRRADGEYRWFMHHKEPLRNELGEIVKWYGSSIDIQERKTAEEKSANKRQTFVRFWTWRRNTLVSLDPMEARATLTSGGSSISALPCGELI